MREIKFRAWDPYTKKMDYDCRDALSFWNGIAVPEGDHIPLQFTGLKDKNGAEIYEGDILKIGPQAYPVVWDDKGTHGWKLDTPHFGIGASQSTFYEVIGNIYENPELLRKHDEDRGAQS